MDNPNSSWVNHRGAWVTNVAMIVGLKIVFSSIPGMSSEASWTLTNLSYNLGTFIMFHWVSGTPFTLNQNENADLTLWEQMDGGLQFTPSKKFLFGLPIVLFLLSTHYTHYDFATFMINLTSLSVVLVSKLPSMHMKRLFGDDIIPADKGD
ncbi:hypothetical protein SmJEL517_g02889 [Synchytrium microbalum]|uniref:ORMDL family protein n=1 Tax=Synchytrium microbalum TaxID=1806994 RepID=A0A507BYU4_9FUNG|nr:uncharacterized protein SmJEL517_g02889 [Synchytrium microbalum]TPX34460.1 hypothetical protein SmJEL517_g02889 [Synchytrium microbalum]